VSIPADWPQVLEFFGTPLVAAAIKWTDGTVNGTMGCKVCE
jgi:hypothetical protein